MSLLSLPLPIAHDVPFRLPPNAPGYQNLYIRPQRRHECIPQPVHVRHFVLPQNPNGQQYHHRQPGGGPPFLRPFDPSADRKGASRYIRNLRAVFPFWNRTLGADHFFLSCDGVGIDSDRNLVELKKNSVQISCFPVKNAPENLFVPHKDVTLPPLVEGHPEAQVDGTPKTVQAYYAQPTEGNDDELAAYLEELVSLAGFAFESRPSDPAAYARRLSSSRFCLFFHGSGMRDLDVWSAMRHGCVPVFISSRPILDLPFADALRWRETALAVAMDGGANRLKRVPVGMASESYEAMRNLGRQASVHLRWNSVPQPYDAFHTVMYQLWRKRHVIRYARRPRS